VAIERVRPLSARPSVPVDEDRKDDAGSSNSRNDRCIPIYPNNNNFPIFSEEPATPDQKRVPRCASDNRQNTKSRKR